MSINFGGLASGMDTEAIISALMNIERAPIQRMERDRDFYSSRLAAFTDFDSKLKDFFAKAEEVDSISELKVAGFESSSEEYFKASGASDAALGNYQIEVHALAQQQKDVSAGYTDKSSQTFGTGNLSLTVGGNAHSIAIDGTNNSLEGIAKAINDAGLGVSASIINDGTASPYRLVLSGDTVADTFTLDASALTGGTDANPVMSNTQIAQQAHIQIDNIDIYSDTNSVKDAISGVTLDLLSADAAVATNLSVNVDESKTEEKIKGFVDAYNEVVNFISEQKDTGWASDSTFRSVKRQMQSMLTSSLVGSSGSYSTLAEIGFETQKDGTIQLDSTRFSDAMTKDFDSVLKLFAGEDGVDGVAKKFADYLEELTNSSDGVLASREEGTEQNLRRIDQRIETFEIRMEAREKTLRAQFTAMEEMMSAMNSQSSFLAQQMASMPTIGGNN